jgi:putative ABC transport system permease protein
MDAMRYWELMWLALGGIRRTPLRVTLTAFGVTIATGALMSMVGFALGVQARVEEPFQKLELLNRIDVSMKKAEEGEPPPPYLDDAAVQRIAAVPGVVVVYPELRLAEVEVRREDHTTKAAADTLPHGAGSLRWVRDTIVAGRFFYSDAADEVILGSELVTTLGFASPAEALGTTLTVEAKGLAPGPDRTFQFEEHRLTLTVVGVWDPPSGRHGYSNQDILLPLERIRAMPGVQTQTMLDRLLSGRKETAGSYPKVVVRVSRPGELFMVKDHLEQMGFRTQTLLATLESMRTAFLMMDFVLTAVGSVALVVAALGIINTLLMAVLERYREIGTFKALGASNGDIRVLFLTEAGLVGLLGGLGGLALGWVVSMVLELVINEYARQQGVHQPVVAFAFPLYLLSGAVLFAVVISVLAGVYPASRAAQVDPIRALRGE